MTLLTVLPLNTNHHKILFAFQVVVLKVVLHKRPCGSSVALNYLRTFWLVIQGPIGWAVLFSFKII